MSNLIFAASYCEAENVPLEHTGMFDMQVGREKSAYAQRRDLIPSSHAYKLTSSVAALNSDGNNRK